MTDLHQPETAARELRPAGRTAAGYFDLDEEAFAEAEETLNRQDAKTPGGDITNTETDRSATLPVIGKNDESPKGLGRDGNEPLMQNRLANEAPSPTGNTTGNTLTSAPLRLGGEKRETDKTLREAEQLAAVCRQFAQLMTSGHHSLRTAAQELGKPASFFSGANSFYARWQRDGLAGLLPARRDDCAPTKFHVPTWFIPAAKFFYLLSNHRRCGGSVPEAVRRVISLPNLPFGWTAKHKERFLKAINQAELPTCPAELRETILARQDAGRELVPARLARQITVNKSVVQMHRSPRAWALDNLSAPGSQRRWFNKQTGQREIMQPGDWFGGDDATPGIAVCVPCNEVNTPCSQKFGVLLGRFQWLAFHDGRTDKILAWDYVVRPRGSYRAEDILNGMGAVVRTHGVPRQGFQFEGGSWNSHLVKQAIANMRCEHWRTYSPHQKAIESVFDRVWTRLAVQFPHADMGRYRAENESNCKLYEACKAGYKDPRHYFPKLADMLRVFEEEVAAHNARRIFSEHYGQWIPDEFFSEAVKTSPLRGFSEEMEWIFSPFAVERKVRGMMVRCRVPMFENFSVPFEFGADWLPLYDGKQVRLHFNPRQPRCTAKLVLLENAGDKKPGDILGDAKLIGETAGHIRYILEWGDDDQRAGYVQRQKTNGWMRRETRGIGVGGRVEYARSEQRDGISKLDSIEKKITAAAGTETEQRMKGRGSADAATVAPDNSAIRDPQSEIVSDDELAELERQTRHLFV